MKKIALICVFVLILITTGIGVSKEFSNKSITEPKSTNVAAVSDDETADVNSSSTEQVSYISDSAINGSDTLSPDEYFIAINLSTNKLTLYQNDKKIKSYDVATGIVVDEISSTPTGQFVVLNKVQDPAWGGGGYADPIAGGDPNNPLGHYWIGISAGDNPGGSIGIHGNINEGSIGAYASHGCIRMHNYDVPELFEIVPLNTEVWIGTSEQLSEWRVTDFD